MYVLKLNFKFQDNSETSQYNGQYEQHENLTAVLLQYTVYMKPDDF
jgi:hypothetical protein